MNDAKRANKLYFYYKLDVNCYSTIHAPITWLRAISNLKFSFPDLILTESEAMSFFYGVKGYTFESAKHQINNVSGYQFSSSFFEAGKKV